MEHENSPTILIVDDEEDIRKMLSRHFRFIGYEVETAAHGKEALKLLKNKRMEVVVSDIKMPEMDGVELLREIKKEYPMIHVIIITGYVTMENLLSTFRHGADTCIFKPLDDLTEIENAVDSAVKDLNVWQKKLKQLNALDKK